MDSTPPLNDASSPSPAGPTGPVGPSGSIADSGMHNNPNLARRADELERCLYQVYLYLGITESGVPVNSTRSLDEFFRLVAAIEADSIHDAAEVDALCETTAQKAAAIFALQTKMEQLVLASLTQSSVALAALQDDINAIHRDLNPSF